MKKGKRRVVSLILSICMIMSSVFIVPMNFGTVKAADFTSETIIKKGFSLTIQQSTDSRQRISSDTLEKIKEVYFTQYPKMRARYNPTRPRAVTMKFDPGYDGVAYTGGDMGAAGIKFSVSYLQSHPNDADCATHELFHVVQGGYMNYNSESFEGAICEGIADYARSVYGLYNSLQGWSLGAYNSSQTILTRYASNARFLTWINQNKNSEATYMLNKTMHDGTYTSDMWVQLTGMTSDELWNAYASDPNIDKITLSTQKGETFGITSGETYKITSAESGLALSVKDNSTENGANIQQENYVEGNESQQWVLNYLGDGLYSIINKKSKKALDIADGSTTNGTNIQQYAFENAGNNNQKWIIFERGNQYTLFPVCGNGTMVADLSSSSHSAGANIQLYSWNKTKAQSFIIEPINISAADDTTLRAFDRIEAEDYVTSCTNINVSVDESASRSNGANIGGLIAGAWTGYYGIVFDSDASSIEINYCNPSSDSYVNVYVDSMDGTPLGVIQTPHNSSDWRTYTTVTADLNTNISAGTHNIYLEFKNSSMSGYAQNCDYFVFGKASEFVTYDGFSKIEAEAFSNQSGVVIDNDSSGAPKNIGGTHNGDWTQYDNVVFAEDAGEIVLTYSCQQGSGGNVLVYADSMDGTPVATIAISSTGSNWNTYVSKTTTLDNIISAGTHTIYLKFETDSGNVVNVDWFNFNKYINTTDASGSVKVEGYQISSKLGGNKVVASVEPTINGQTVTGWGLIYGLAKANGVSHTISDEDMCVGSENEYVRSYKSTSEGTLNVQMGESSTAIYYVRTMLFANYTAEAFNAEYKVRAYAVLADGSYVYSDVRGYSIYNIADNLYKNTLMNTKEAHDFLYEKILNVVDADYKEVDYDWGNTVVRPE